MCGRYQFSAAESDDLRQIVRSVQKRCGQDELNFRITVSYTHLDVYKRQPVECRLHATKHFQCCWVK